MRRLALVTAVLNLLLGCAHADRAQIADGATTAVALSSGFAEANPLLSGLSGPVILVAKIGVTQVVKQAPNEVCEPGLLGLTAAGYGAALWNIGVLAGSGPAAIPVVAILALWQWDSWESDARNTCAPGIVGSTVPYIIGDDEYDLLVYREGGQ